MQRRQINYLTLVGYLLLTGGCLVGGWLLISLLATWQASDWPSTDALIYRSDIVYTTSHPGDSQQGFYRVDISYRYLVDGRRYEGTGIYRADIPYLSLSEAAHLTETFPAGTVTRVWYAPEDPDYAILQQGVSMTFLLLLAPALLFAALGISLIKRTATP